MDIFTTYTWTLRSIIYKEVPEFLIRVYFSSRNNFLIILLFFVTFVLETVLVEVSLLLRSDKFCLLWSNAS